MMPHPMLASVLASVALLAVADPVLNGTKAARICRPSPPSPTTNSTSGVPTCLVIGDSVSLGYTGSAFGAPGSGGNLAKNMTGTCDVLHAPFSGDGGACDTRYGLQCADLWLGRALGGEAAPKYSVITFNFGLHDTNDEAFDEEARDEGVPAAEYGANLVAFVKKIREHQPQAQLAWLSSTPMHFDMHLNGNVVEYNTLAHKLLVAGKLVDSFVDMYKVVTDVCGQPPYYGSKLAPSAPHHCSLIGDNEEYHYISPGWQLLASTVATEIKALLKKGPRTAAFATAAGAAGKGARQDDGKMCADGKTNCPTGTTCVADKFSDSKFGCCMLPAASGCGDGFHCCASGTSCRTNGTNPVSSKKPSPLSYSHVCVPNMIHTSKPNIKTDDGGGGDDDDTNTPNVLMLAEAYGYTATRRCPMC